MNLLSINKLHFLNCGPVDVEIKPMEIIGLSGASGTGKSRLLRAVADLDEHQGSIYLNGVNQMETKAYLWRRNVALLSADTQWWFDTVSPHFSNLTEHDLKALGFNEDVSNWSVSRLSSGEKQRLGLLRLLENNPEVLLLDEPTANLDKNNTKLFEDFVLEYLKKRPACAIWVSHDAEQLQRISQRNFEIKNGVLV